MTTSRRGRFGWTIAAVVMSRGGVGCWPAFGQAGDDEAGCGKTMVASADGGLPYQAEDCLAGGGGASRTAPQPQPG